MEPNTDKLKMLEEMNEELSALDEVEEVESMIQDNTIEFSFNEKEYRIRKLNRREKHELRDVKNREKDRLVRQGYMTEDEVIATYLKREQPIDIPKLHQKIRDLQHQIDKQAIKYTECKIDSEKNRIKEDIQDIKLEQLKIGYDIDEYLSTCIEKQLKSFLQEYMIYLCLEEKCATGWKRHYSSYNDFMATQDEAEDKLVYKATWYFSVLMEKND